MSRHFHGLLTGRRQHNLVTHSNSRSSSWPAPASYSGRPRLSYSRLVAIGRRLPYGVAAVHTGSAPFLRARPVVRLLILLTARRAPPPSFLRGRKFSHLIPWRQRRRRRVPESSTPVASCPFFPLPRFRAFLSPLELVVVTVHCCSLGSFILRLRVFSGGGYRGNN